MILRKRMAELLEQGHHMDRASHILNLLLILLISMNVVAIFLETVDSVYAQYQRAFQLFEIFSVVIFSVEYLLRVWSSIDLEEADDTSPVMGRIRYMLTPIALIDLIAILPFYLSLYLNIDLRFLRVLRLLRLFKLTRYSPALSAMLDVIQKEAEALLAAFVVLLTMLIISAGGIYIFESELQPETFGSMPDSMWWAIVTLTTVGYGDVVPMTTTGRMFAGLIGLIGIGMIALPAAIMASGFAENVRRRKEKYHQHIEEYARDGVLDESERGKLRELAEELSLDSEDAMQLLDSAMQEARHAALDKCPHCGERLN